MLVVDTSAVLEALAASYPEPGLIERLSQDGDLHAPHLIDTELLHALRRMSMRQEIGNDRAEDARRDFAELALIRYRHQPLNDRVWALRKNVTAYDATFIALAEALSVPLITCDTRLAASSGHRAQIELFEVSSK